MPTSLLTGSRIRERRIARAMKQADLARRVEISPSYLNLIEHNRRRIGGKLLVDLARILEVEPAQLSQGAEGALVTALRDAAARNNTKDDFVDSERAEDFAGRFPGWAGLVMAQARRVEDLERLVETLSDRLAHDPHLAASLHEVISTVTAIRSTASILAGGDVDPDWQSRFLRNIGEESRRLSDSAEGLVGYLDAGAEAEAAPVSPADNLAAFVEKAGYHFPTLEGAGAGEAEVDALLAEVDVLRDAGARDMARGLLTRYRHDARALPRSAFETSARAVNHDPARLAASFGVGVDMVLRRLASVMPATEEDDAFDVAAPRGLVICDGSGTLTLRRPIEGFAVPRFGAACPLWPLYQALARPGQPVQQTLDMPGPTPRRFLCQAVSMPRPADRFDAVPVYEATMLISPLAAPEPGMPLLDGETALAAGSSCRVCPREACSARREPSILGEQAA
ncbi:MAG: short-chain fatty acyl-CoA regulator family protein [Maritimibacter sp.]